MSSEPLVYFNGEFLPISQAKLSLTDWGLHGVAATEMTRTFGHRCFRLDDHLDRLNASMCQLGLQSNLLRDDWQEITRTVTEYNAELISSEHDLLVNHLVTAGENPAYGRLLESAGRTTVTICVQAFPIPFARWAKQYEIGQHLIVPAIRQIPAECLDPKIKSRNRLLWYLADRQAKVIGTQTVA